VRRPGLPTCHCLLLPCSCVALCAVSVFMRQSHSSPDARPIPLKLVAEDREYALLKCMYESAYSHYMYTDTGSFYVPTSDFRPSEPTGSGAFSYSHSVQVRLQVQSVEYQKTGSSDDAVPRWSWSLVSGGLRGCTFAWKFVLPLTDTFLPTFSMREGRVRWVLCAKPQSGKRQWQCCGTMLPST
jgi:hypothetical protein